MDHIFENKNLTLIDFKGDRIWFFALSIYFVTINKDSLLMTAISGLTCNIFSILLGPILGGLVDKHQRIKGIPNLILRLVSNFIFKW